MVRTFVIDSRFPILVPDSIATNLCASPARTSTVHALRNSMLPAVDVCDGEMRHEQVPYRPTRRVFRFRLHANSKEGELIAKPLRAAGEIARVVPPFNLICRMAGVVAGKFQDVP